MKYGFTARTDKYRAKRVGQGSLDSQHTTILRQDPKSGTSIATPIGSKKAIDRPAAAKGFSRLLLPKKED
jgi:hypothetical protein